MKFIITENKIQKVAFKFMNSLFSPDQLEIVMSEKYPNLIWVTDTLIPHLMLNYGIFQTKNNFLLGLSTGARGSILLGIKTDTLFKKAACLSGRFHLQPCPCFWDSSSSLWVS